MTDTNGARAPLPDVDVLFFDGFDELDSIGPWEVLSAAGFPVRAAGFQYAAIDCDGYRSGSMNEVLPLAVLTGK